MPSRGLRNENYLNLKTGLLDGWMPMTTNREPIQMFGNTSRAGDQRKRRTGKALKEKPAGTMILPLN
jgi:hypothetical protein